MDINYDTLVYLVQHFGYAALFFALWLGIVGMPIPDELVVMTSGALTISGLLNPVLAFGVTYLGVVSGLSLGYILGRFLGTSALDKWLQKNKMEKYLRISESMTMKYGSFALCISYFFPVIRHVMPYLVGINKMSFSHYALISYSAGLVWTFLFFMLGRFFGTRVQEAGYLIYNYELKMIWVPVVIIIVWMVIKSTFARVGGGDRVG